MALNITKEEAEAIRERAIAKAIRLDIVAMIRYILLNEPSIPDAERGEVYNIDRSAPLPGSGFILQMNAAGRTVFTIKVVAADNPTDHVLLYEKTSGGEAYKCFREGPWVHMLQGHYQALKYRLENKVAMDLLKRYSPFGDPKGLRNE